MAGNASSEEGVYRTSGGYEVSWRARRRSGTKAPGLRVSPRQGVVVTLPLGSRLDPRDVLRRYDTWLERAVRRTAGQRQAYLQSQEAAGFFLATDDGCDFGFYDHLGLERIAARETPIAAEGLGEQPFHVYLYGALLGDPCDVR